MDSASDVKMGPNVEQIRAQATRVVCGPIPRAVRTELMNAVKHGLLGRLKKDGLKPEIFFHPDHKHGAIDLQKREALYAAECIARVMVRPAEVRDGVAQLEGKADYADTAAFRARANAPPATALARSLMRGSENE